MKHWIRWTLILVTIVCALGLYVNHRISGLDEPIGEAGEPIVVDISEGMTFKQIVIRLEQVGAVQDPLVFEWYGRYSGLGQKIQPGHYVIEPDWTPKELLATLSTRKKSHSVRVHIPAGWNRWQIADRFSNMGLIDRNEFLNRVRMESLEGKLYPGNYSFKREVNTSLVLENLTQKFDSEWPKILNKHDDRHGLSEDEILILASIVQKESVVYADQQKVARVFYNRLKKGQKLQTDPTCVYGVDRYQRKPNPKDCRDPENPYSTYVIKGLPPTPIGSPGRQAIEATLSPFNGDGAERIFFFVARRDGSGQHHFSETYAEHKRADRRARKVKD